MKQLQNKKKYFCYDKKKAVQLTKEKNKEMNII